MPPRSEQVLQEIRSESRELVLKAALSVFAEKGFHGATMADLARRAKISKGLAYLYFRSKDEILEALIEKRINQVSVAFRTIPPAASPSQKLGILFDSILEDARSNPEIHRVYLSALLSPGGFPALKRAINREKHRFADFEQQILNLFTELGSPDPEVESVAFWTSLDGIILNYLVLAELYPLAKIRKRFLAQFSRKKRS